MISRQVKIYDALSHLESVAPNLWIADNCFDLKTFEWLTAIVDTEGNEFVTGALKKRLQLKHTTHDQARLNEIGISQTASFESLTNTKLEFVTAKFWLDLPQFGCQIHSDSPDLYVNYQVYVAASPGADVACVGAEFLHISPPYRVELKPNHGYININSDLKLHWVYGGHGTRTSVMFQYARV